MVITVARILMGLVILCPRPEHKKQLASKGFLSWKLKV